MVDPKERLLRIGEALEITSISRSVLYDMMARDEVPRGVRIGKRGTRWRQGTLRPGLSRCLALLPWRQGIRTPLVSVRINYLNIRHNLGRVRRVGRPLLIIYYTKELFMIFLYLNGRS